MSVELWHSWNNGGRSPERLTPLLAAYKPLIDREVTRWSGSGLPKIVLESEAKRLAIQSFHGFDPSKGAQVQTNIINHLKGMDRFVNLYRSDVRLPEEKVHLGNKVYKAKQDLELMLGREATVDEIAEHSGVSRHTIGTLKKFQAGLYSNNEMGGFNQPVREDITHDEIVRDFLYSDLSPMQQLVFTHATGHGGRPVLSTNEMAKKLNVSASRVSGLRDEIATKARRYQHAVGSLMS